MKQKQKINIQKGLMGIVLILIIGLASGLNASAAGSGTATSLVVDYDMTKVDKPLTAGDSGILFVVIRNTGGLQANDVRASILYSSGVSVSDAWKLGTINSGQSATITTVINVPNNTKAGTYLLTLYLDYKAQSYDSSGSLVTKEESSQWKIPVDIYGNPNFQISVEKTDFYKDTASEIIIKGFAKAEIRDLNSILTGDCVTVIGSEKKYLGNLGANQDFVLNYTIKPNKLGTCIIAVSLNYIDNSGKMTSESTKIGLSVLEPDVDLKVTGVDFGSPSPGDLIDLKIKIKNIGGVPAEDVTAAVNLDTPFVPVETSELYVGDIGANEEKEISFKISINPGASIQAYKIPLLISYKIGGVEYIGDKSIGLNVAGEVNLEVINVGIVSSKLRIDVANTGTRTANAVKATLNFGGSKQVAYKDALNPTKQTTFSFDIPAGNRGQLVLEYIGQNNNKTTISEDITLASGASGASGNYNSSRSSSQSNLNSQNAQSSGSSEFPLWVIGVISVIIIAVVYKFRKHLIDKFRKHF